MAGDWIKMRIALAEDPAVIAMAARLNLDEFAIVGRLHHLWGWADVQSRDGHAPGVTNVWIDRYVRCDGFATQMQAVGWLIVTEFGIEFPRFDRHNGETAKTRASATRRKQKQRANVTTDAGQMSRDERDKSATREEKRREELTTPYGRRHSDVAVDNSAEARQQQKNETTTEGNRTDSQTPNTESQESGAGGAADASDGSGHAKGGASGMAPGNREPDDDLPPLAVSMEWFRQRGVLIDHTNDLLIGWRRAGVTEGQFTVAIAKAKQYKLKHIPANYLAQIVDEMVNPPERASKRISLGDDEQSLKAAARELGMDEGRQGESLKQYKARILERMNQGGRHA
ncbi:hypothetical protein [Burkholderia ubonensis]|uniref:hypothetical protein n=1 Tax=Burkholderia ubonensis TaxID=101571 RepID=UPI000A40A90F|nr:hypothetical protein [Burkholderia ubonensis]